MVSNPFPISIGTSAKRATHSDDERTALGIANEHATANLYYGHTSELTTADGFPILPKTSLFFNVGFGDRPDLEFWLISDTVATPVKLMEFSKGGV